MTNKDKKDMKNLVDLSGHPAIEGYDFDKKFNFDKFVKAYSSTGIQATHFGMAVSIVKNMIREKVPIFLSFTSNMISSGVREQIRYLTKNKKIAVLCTSGGGAEEDIMKSRMPFRLGKFNANGENLLDAGVSRIGNIFTTTEHYTYFDFFMTKVFKELLKLQKKGEVITQSKICWMMGKMVEKEEEYDHKSSVLYWAYKNKIPVYCPTLMDGTVGMLAYYFKKSNPDFAVELLADQVQIIDYAMNLEKSAAIILGGGTPKHYILGANIFKEGFDYSVYITTATEHDASDSGGDPEEAVSWEKINPKAPRVKVVSEASIAFPLLVAATFAKK